MVRFGGKRGPRFQGIRFRLGVAMAFALLPILLLGAIQSQAAFRADAEERRNDLVLAAERSAANAWTRLDSTLVLLEALRPESLGLYCESRLRALVDRLPGYDALLQFSPTGQVVCASKDVPPTLAATGADWFDRLRGGEDMAVVRAPPEISPEPALLVAVRSERPLGAFDGALTALLPLSELRPVPPPGALPDGSEVALTDAQGRVLTSTNPQAFAVTAGQGAAGWVERARADPSTLFEGVDASGQRRVFAGAAIAGRDVYVLISAPDPGLLSWARLDPIGVFVLPILAWLVTLIAVMIFSERIIIRWLDYLERVAALYAKGRFSVRPVQAVSAPSELRIFARTLDDMAEAISIRDASLMESIAEKDALLREIHHRVKNNLQIISSLLSMQQRALTDPAARAAINDTRQRISALALIYRTLYQSADIRRADLSDFLNELVGQLIASESGRGPMVTSAVDADSLVIDPDKLAPLALWAVEAVTNAQKHAFAGRGGSLKVRFNVNGPESVLEVEDDGGGFGPDAAQGVGRTLMTAFARQLRGQTELVPSPTGGAIARLVFPTPEAEDGPASHDGAPPLPPAAPRPAPASRNPVVPDTLRRGDLSRVAKATGAS